jgi:biopolymer transport protein ExbD
MLAKRASFSMLVLAGAIALPAVAQRSTEPVPDGFQRFTEIQRLEWLEPGGVATIGFNEAGKVTWNGEVIDDEQLENRLALVAQVEPETRVSLSAGAMARYEDIERVMKVIQASGAKMRLGLITGPRTEQP